MSNKTTKQIEDGGPAFAAAGESSLDGWHEQRGMSLRDWFAGQALNGMTGTCWPADVVWPEITRRAYIAADAMIAARAARGGAQ